MGLIFSWFRKPSTNQLLEEIQEKLDSIADHQRNVQLKTRQIGRYVVYVFVLYLIVGLCAYWYWLPNTPKEWLFYAAPFGAFPPLVMMVKRLLLWYYNRQLRSTRGQVEILKKKKQELLDKVLETETYKVGKEILQKYAPEQLTPMKLGLVTAPTQATPDSGVRQRNVSSAATPATAPHLTTARTFLPTSPAPPPRAPGGGPLFTPRPPAFGASSSATTSSRLAAPVTRLPLNLGRPPAGVRPGAPLNSSFGPSPRPPGVPMPRPVAPRDRGIMERLIDYLMKEGPNNSYALICRQCETHNGMALKEDFPYMAYRCAYCHYWNPARKQRPAPPRLETIDQIPSPPAVEDDSSSESESKDSDEDACDKQSLKTADVDKKGQVSGPSTSDSDGYRLSDGAVEPSVTREVDARAEAEAVESVDEGPEKEICLVKSGSKDEVEPMDVSGADPTIS